MRNLETHDIFSAVRLLNKIGVREEIREVAKQAEENKTKTIRFDMGFDLMLGILEKATSENSETEIYKFIANLFECEWEEVRKMNPITLMKNLEKVANFEEWKSFFDYVKRLMKQN